MFSRHSLPLHRDDKDRPLEDHGETDGGEPHWVTVREVAQLVVDLDQAVEVGEGVLYVVAELELIGSKAYSHLPRRSNEKTRR